MSGRIIRVVTAVVRDEAGRLLLVRKRGTTVFMQPGGKPEPGEAAHDALVRELAEELSVTVAPDALEFLGRYRAAAANEPDHLVEATMFALNGRIAPVASGEIVELWWRDDETADERPIAPLTRRHVIGRR